MRLALGASAARILRQILPKGCCWRCSQARRNSAHPRVPSSAGSPLPAIRDRGAVLQPLAVHVSINAA